MGAGVGFFFGTGVVFATGFGAGVVGLGRGVATAVGFSMAVGVSAVHLPPRWSALSDSLPDGNVSPVTWVAVVCEIAGALAFGWAGLRHLLRD